MSQTLTQGQLLLLRVAREYREQPESWVQDVFGYLPNGKEIDSDDRAQIDAAIIRCPDAALMHFGPQYGRSAVREARNLIYAQLGCRQACDNIWDYNDEEGRTVEEVITMLEAAARVKITTTASLVEYIKQRAIDLAESVAKVAGIAIPA